MLSLVLVALGMIVPVASAQAATPQFGFKDQSFTGASTAPSGSKPESKLWYNDGIWWGSMWSSTAAQFRIFRLNSAGTAWTDTGVAIDSRGSTKSDALWDGSHLYIASHDEASDSSHNTAGRPARLYRYSYSNIAKVYTLDAGFPVQIANVATETMVIDKDSTGVLWATWTQAKKLVVAHSVGGDTTWTAGFTPAITGTTLGSDDVSSLIAFGGNKIGVMWSNQSSSHMYFTSHVDGASDTSWSASEAATSGSGSADDHINLKADSAGRVYVAAKTSFTASSATLTHLLVRSTGGSWSDIRFGTVAESNTRPIVLIDEQNGVVHMYATGPWATATSGQSGGTIYEKTAPINAISFASGRGTPVIQDPGSADMNNATSTKQNVTSSSGIVVVATNDTKKFYWHSYQSLGAPPPPPPPVASFTGTPTTGSAPLNVQFSDNSTGNPTSWSWNFGDPGSGAANTSTSQNPSHSYAADGTYTVSLTVTNASGNDTRTRANYIVVATPPVANFTGAPTTGNGPLEVQFTDSSTAATSWSWDFGDPGSGAANTSAVQNPTHTYNDDGSYTVTLTATNDNGSSVKTRTSYIHVGSAPAASFDASATSGNAPLGVTFTDTTTNNPTSWSWNFGDPGSGAANTSTQQNPSHTYNNGGTYTVSLTATNASGSDTVTRTNLITVTGSETTVTLTPTADAHVTTSNSGANYGAVTTLKVREGDGSTTNPTYHAYLKFDTSGISGTVSAVTLRLFVTDAAASVVSVYVVPDSGWTQTGITYNNAPAIPDPAVGSTKSAPAGAYVSITLEPTSVTPGAPALTLGLKNAGSDSFVVSSREAASNTPELVVTYQ